MPPETPAAGTSAAFEADGPLGVEVRNVAFTYDGGAASLHWQTSVFVVVAFMLGMAVAVMDVVDVLAVLDRFVGAVRTSMLVLGRGVFCRIIVFVVMALVLRVAVAFMDIVHVVAVLDRYVGAVRTAVPVLGGAMFCFDFLGHDLLLRSSVRRQWPPAIT